MKKGMNDRTYEIGASAHTVAVQVFLVVVVPRVLVDVSNAEELGDRVETVDTLRALSHREFVPDLEARLVALSGSTIGLSNEVYGEASLSIHEPRNPANEDQALVFHQRR